MKKILSVFVVLLYMSVMSAYSQDHENAKDTTPVTVQSDTSKAQSNSSVADAVMTVTPKTVSESDILLYIALGVSALSLILAVLLFLLSQKKQKDALSDIDYRYNSKLSALKEDALTESMVKLIAETVAKDYADEVQSQISVRIQAMMMAKEAAVTSPARAEQVPVFEPRTLYASFSPSYCGFRGDEISQDKTSYATFRITTTDEKRAVYQLIENVSSSLIDSSQLEALDYSGSAQSYSYIRLGEPGELEYVEGSDYWQIKRKAVISFE